jgi:hydrogenase maturation protein HypF
MATPPEARFLRIRGVVQGVGFRPFVFRLAQAHGIAGWVRNGGEGVEIHAEIKDTKDPKDEKDVKDEALEDFVRALQAEAPPASRIASFETAPAAAQGFECFEILESAGEERPTVRISPDLPVCAACLAELFDLADRRFGYPYINCTDCGPRYTIVLGLPYDRPRTTMRDWPLCPDCAREYEDPLDRRFHAQPVACPVCGPRYVLHAGEERWGSEAAIPEAARLLREGLIVAVKGLGGYHLAADARNAAAVAALRERKVRKEKPFAVMAKDLSTACALIDLSPDAEALLTSVARPIVLAPRRADLPAATAPENSDLGVMLPYTPVHHLLFAAGAPDVLVMTSANRSNEPLAYRDDEAFERLAGIADAFLAGERPIARRVDDSVVRAGCLGPTVLRRARGLAPGAVARLPLQRPILAVGADLKNTVTLVVDGEAFVSQHIGDLQQYEAFAAFQETVRDLMAMYEVDWGETLVMHDLHPQYASTAYALGLPAAAVHAVQHHRAHIASVLAEHGAFAERILGVACDGTGYGDDGGIWGGEFFAGSIAGGFERIAHLRGAVLPGGDAAARHPVQSAAGFLTGIDSIEGLPDLTAPPFGFPVRYLQALELISKNVRVFPTTSLGRLFDAAAALLGFTREATFEGQAAVWLEHRARAVTFSTASLPFPFDGRELDFRPALAELIESRRRGGDCADLARAFHRGLARGLADAILALTEARGLETVVLSGGVFQNELLLRDLKDCLAAAPLRLWMSREVPPNDEGISLGQAAMGVS